MQKIIDEYLKDKDSDPLPSKYTVSKWNKLNFLYNNGLLKRNSIFELINNELKVIYNFEKNKKDIIKWCNLNNINEKIFIEYLNNLIDVKIEL